MTLFHQLLDSGRAGEAVEQGYELAQTHRNDPNLVLTYVGLMFHAFDEHQIPMPTEVGVDSSFRIESEDGKVLWLTIEGSEDRVAEGRISTSNAFATNAIGHAVGYKFTLKHGFDKLQEWTIKEIKHKFLYLLHDILENFETQFPGVRGISTVSMKDGDIEPVLSQVRKLGQQREKVIELYTQKNLPLAVVAAQTHRDPVSFADEVRASGHDIKACIGQHVERIEALQTIAQHKAAGVVLDTFTAWTVAQLDLFELLQNIFGQVVIPRSVFHDLESLLGQREFDERQSLSMGWHNGEFYKHAHTREEFDARRDFISSHIDKIKKHCVVVPVDAPDAAHPDMARIIAWFGADPLNSAAIAGTGYLLVAEDVQYRKWAELLWSAKGIWLQAVLDYAAHVGIISLEEYANWLGKLAQRRHGFIFLSGVTMNALVGRGEDENSARVHAAFDFIGRKDADILSHAHAIVSFINVAWKTGNRGLHFEKALGLALENLVRGRPDTWYELVWLVFAQVGPRAQRYVLQWVRGHFLNPAPIFAMHRHYLQQSLSSAIGGVYERMFAGNMTKIWP
jgi:hypothetical protein